jgi:hypothetical protein
MCIAWRKQIRRLRITGGEEVLRSSGAKSAPQDDKRFLVFEVQKELASCLEQFH